MEGRNLVRPGNSKISLLILSWLRVSDYVLRQRLFGHETWGRIMARGSLQRGDEPRNLCVLFRVDRKKRKPLSVLQQATQSYIHTLKGFSLGSQPSGWARKGSCSPADTLRPGKVGVWGPGSLGGAAVLGGWGGEGSRETDRGLSSQEGSGSGF